MVVARDYRLSVSPLTPARIEEFTENTIFKERLSGAAAEKFRKTVVTSGMGSKTCFVVAVYSKEEDAANLKYFDFFLDAAKAQYRLQSQAPIEKPEKKSKLTTYTSGGYVISGFHFPSETFVDQSDYFTSSGIYCSPSKVEVASGFSVYIEPFYKKGLILRDLVWSTKPEDESLYAEEEGMPNIRDAKEWVEANSQATKKKVALIKRSLGLAKE